MESCKEMPVDRTNKALAKLAIMRLIEKKRKEHKRPTASRTR